MRDEHIQQQADAFLAFHDKTGGPVVPAFRRWADGKRFQPGDEGAVFGIVLATLLLRDAAERRERAA